MTKKKLPDVRTTRARIVRRIAEARGMIHRLQQVCLSGDRRPLLSLRSRLTRAVCGILGEDPYLTAARVASRERAVYHGDESMWDLRCGDVLWVLGRTTSLLDELGQGRAVPGATESLVALDSALWHLEREVVAPNDRESFEHGRWVVAYLESCKRTSVGGDRRLDRVRAAKRRGDHVVASAVLGALVDHVRRSDLLEIDVQAPERYLHLESLMWPEEREREKNVRRAFRDDLRPDRFIVEALERSPGSPATQGERCR